MIPLQLKIRNFLSYGPQGETIDFTPHHLICLTGKNGHGKSALLDAITWALWGQARKVAGVIRSDEHLVRLGQSGMAVTLDFSCGGQRYRVTRDFSMAMNRKGITQLHLGLFKEDIDAYVSLSERNMRDTQDKLDAIIGLSYDTFINSVFLRQGQANEFSKKSPLERKEILCSLLGLTRYEELRKRAIEQQRAYEKEHEILGHLTTSLTTELSAKADTVAQAENIEQQLASIDAAQKEQIGVIEGLSKKLAESTQAQTALALINQQAVQCRQRHAQLILSLKTLLNERKSYQQRAKILDATALGHEQNAITTQLTNIETIKNRQIGLKEQLLLLTTEKQNRLTTLQTALHARLQTIAQQREQARFAAERAQAALDDTTKQIAATETHNRELVEKRDTLSKTLSQQEVVNAAIANLEHHKTRTERFKERWQLRMQQNDQAHTAAQERLHRLTTHNSTCPLCTQQLPDAHRTVLIAHAQKITQRLQHTNKRLAQLLHLLTIKQTEYEKTLKKYTSDKEEFARTANQLAQINEQLAQIQENRQRAAIQHTELSTLHTKAAAHLIETENIYRAASADLATIPMQDTTLQAYAEQLTTLETELNQLTAILATTDQHALRTRLTEIAMRQKEIALLGHEQALNKKRRAQICAVMHEIRATLHEQLTLEKQLTKIRPIVDERATDEQFLQKTRTEFEALQHKKQLLLEQKGALARQLLVLEKRALELQTNQARIAQLAELIEDHQLLAQALGKNGIQALIIEQTVPELEAEANALLTRLTENQAQVMFESLRDLKGGGAKETLDIKISDTMGTRPYELFSGGEAFRIDFALRIALSKLLARRAGTTLQTLIIDEGFGSQDEEGLALIQEALHAIQDDFEKVIIVSHLPAMKHQFPTNFIVHKGAEGSTVSVVEQG